jgi:medium-chain acyl-[acyl-carrier-protein] hydrolase
VTVAETPWLVWWRRGPAPRLSLFCLPNAGAGAAAFRSWPKFVPEEIDVAALRLPGRESRLAERPIDDLAELAKAAVPELVASLRSPFVFFGHCSGAWGAFEIARELRRQGLPQPARFVVAAQAAPSLKTEPSEPVEDVRERLRDLGGTDPEILEHDALFDLLRPMVEADFRAVDAYRYVPDAPFDFPISVMVGADDSDVLEDGVGAWQLETTEELDVRRLPGGHFFAGADWHRLARAVGEAALSRPRRRHPSLSDAGVGAA